MKPNDVAPLGTTNETGVAYALELVMVIARPPAGAVPLRVTLPVNVVRPRTIARSSFTAMIVGAITSRMAVLRDPCTAPVIVAVMRRATGLVVIRNVTVRCPAGIVITAGTTAAGSELTRAMVYPPTGAGELMAATPLTGLPPDITLGDICSVVTLGANTVKPAVFVKEFRLALTTALRSTVGFVVVIRN